MVSTSVTVPAGHHALLLINFTAESECYGGSTSADDYCLVEAFVDGADATPGNPGYAFNSTNQGTNSDVNWQSTSEDYSIYVGPGTHHIQMKEAVTDVGATGTQFLWIDDRQMTVQVSLAS